MPCEFHVSDAILLEGHVGNDGICEFSSIDVSKFSHLSSLSLFPSTNNCVPSVNSVGVSSMLPYFGTLGWVIPMYTL